LTVDKDGTIHSETRGFKGDTCLTTLKTIFDKAGIVVKDAKIQRTNESEAKVVERQTV